MGQSGIMLAALSLVGLAALTGVGSAQTQGVPTNTVEPRITGTAMVGSRLTATRGSWTESPTSYGYQWNAVRTGGAADASNCAVIGGASTEQYVLQADVGKRLRVRVTASNADGAKTVASNATAIVVKGGKPANTGGPSISGTAAVGSTLTATKGEWTGTDPIDVRLRVAPLRRGRRQLRRDRRCNDTTYVLKSVDLGNSMRVRVTAKNRAGTTRATTSATSVIRASAPPVVNGCSKTGGTIPISGIAPPARLTIDQTQISPSNITYGTRSLTARFHVSACSGSVEGALVYVTAVPYGQFGIPNEQPTGSDGWATLQFTAKAGFPVSNKQQLLVMFVRARKSGENLLGGISTRRLVSFRVTNG